METRDSLAEALAATESEPFVVIAGSLYLIGEAMEQLQVTVNANGDEKKLNEWMPPASWTATVAMPTVAVTVG
ncbi:MAG: hypothetical protein BWX84_00407 [Verrucomicrobia bacterium ADurb.Bin118]|nr:MAG: hypothetical protein BWX84_00407 [Verrucomicrobia bacterium ADurb.Bin118]